MLRDIEPIDKGPSLEVHGVAILRYSENNGDGVIAICAVRMPPSARRTHPVEGFTLKSGERIQVLIGLDAPAGTGGSLRRVRVSYTVDGRPYFQDFQHRIEILPEVSTARCPAE